MKQLFTASIWQESEWFIAQCMQVDVASPGATEDEALDNLRDALKLHFTPPNATVVPSVRNIEVDIQAARAHSSGVICAGCYR
jgi:predicted RNase H-like HicB family nuclease